MKLPIKYFLSKCDHLLKKSLTLSWRRPLSYGNQSFDLQTKSMDWFLYDNGLCLERVNGKLHFFVQLRFVKMPVTFDFSAWNNIRIFDL